MRAKVLGRLFGFKHVLEKLLAFDFKYMAMFFSGLSFWFQIFSKQIIYTVATPIECNYYGWSNCAPTNSRGKVCNEKPKEVTNR